MIEKMLISPQWTDPERIRLAIKISSDPKHGDSTDHAEVLKALKLVQMVLALPREFLEHNRKKLARYVK